MGYCAHNSSGSSSSSSSSCSSSTSSRSSNHDNNNNIHTNNNDSTPLLLNKTFKNYSTVTDDTNHREEQVSCIEKYIDLFSTSLYLENTLAVARDHLANERTFLAWVRTSLSTISAGVAVTQLFRLDKENNSGRFLGMAFVVIGILYMMFACLRYFHTQTSMTKGYFPASRSIILITSTVTLSALIAVFFIIISRF
ncbi:hypothetical protein BCV72DRAFT_197932 [Rhizopus microsporus var. microsporus]|uniref:DUF202 domain-containing protein n=3 Tax=Rhizopus microsporus TaxID=58291 RepID=A0A2G4SU03_RHIZD|nr:uncharacterized protein RHIMIDRAFT_203154 [Rhizopus microsporus ATCC 52813]ORE11345.1 hypothetical protein BCV72DRAFT_197932 [Rhizopus microsporus var. microsporus]PHZ12234.1 hypothetical protein RHIMIDRAFT_203154 [Rhizopus microsporus ATCC 52813]